MNCVCGVTAREFYICTSWEVQAFPVLSSISYQLDLGVSSMTVFTQFCSAVEHSTVTVLKPLRPPVYQQPGTNTTVAWTRISAVLIHTIIIGHGFKLTPSTAHHHKRSSRNQSLYCAPISVYVLKVDIPEGVSNRNAVFMLPGRSKTIRNFCN